MGLSENTNRNKITNILRELDKLAIAWIHDNILWLADWLEERRKTENDQTWREASEMLHIVRECDGHKNLLV